MRLPACTERFQRCDRVELVLSVDELRADVETGSIDTVIAASYHILGAG